MSRLQYVFFIIVISLLMKSSPGSRSKELKQKNTNVCPPGRYGMGCILRCPKECRTCDDKEACMQCVGRRALPSCRKCMRGYFGARCDKVCVGCDRCDDHTGECLQCRESGRKLPDCLSPCPAGTFGHHCVERCPLSCADSCDVSTGRCLECLHGTGPSCRINCTKAEDKYACKLYCPTNCEGFCNASSGQCQECAAGYMTPACSTRCQDGRFGKNCRHTCPRHCRGGRCDAVSGKCQACASGFMGPKCESQVQCRPGFYGDKCLRCPQTCARGLCHPDTGICESCHSGYMGPMCNQPCQTGTYGTDCKLTCPGNCRADCDAKTGRCWECRSGFLGNICNETCPLGRYGENCSQQCSEFCKSKHCDPIQGGCFECQEGTHGVFCNNRCSEYCKDDRCNAINGHCLGCPPRRNGSFCNVTIPKSDDILGVPIVAVYIFIATVIPVVIVSIPMCIYRFYIRRQIKRQKEREAALIAESGLPPITIAENLIPPGTNNFPEKPAMEPNFKDISLKIKSDKFNDFNVKCMTRSETSKHSETPKLRTWEYTKTEVVSSFFGSKKSAKSRDGINSDNTCSITPVRFNISQDNTFNLDQPPSWINEQQQLSPGDEKVVPHKSLSSTCIHESSDSDSDITLTTVDGARRHQYKHGHNYILYGGKLIYNNGRMYNLTAIPNDDNSTEQSISMNMGDHDKEDNDATEKPSQYQNTASKELDASTCILCDQTSALINKMTSRDAKKTPSIEFSDGYSKGSRDLLINSPVQNKRTKSAPAVPERSSSTRLRSLTVPMLADELPTIIKNYIPSESSSYSSGKLYHGKQPIMSFDTDEDNKRRPIIKQSSPSIKRPMQRSPSVSNSYSPGKLSPIKSPSQVNIRMNQSSPTIKVGDHRTPAYLPKELIAELRAGFSKMSKLLHHVSPNHNKKTISQEPPGEFNNQTENISTPYQSSDETSANSEILLKENVLRQSLDQYQDQQSDHSDMRLYTSSDSSYSLCSSCKNKPVEQLKQNHLHIVTRDIKITEKYSDKHDYNKTKLNDRKEYEPLIASRKRQQENVIKLSEFPSIYSNGKQTSFKIIKERQNPASVTPVSMHSSLHSSQSKPNMVARQSSLSKPNTSASDTFCSSPNGFPENKTNIDFYQGDRPPPPPPPPRTTSMLKKSPLPLPTPSPERMKQLQRDSERPLPFETHKSSLISDHSHKTKEDICKGNRNTTLRETETLGNGSIEEDCNNLISWVGSRNNEPIDGYLHSDTEQEKILSQPHTLCVIVPDIFTDSNTDHSDVRSSSVDGSRRKFSDTAPFDREPDTTRDPSLNTRHITLVADALEGPSLLNRQRSSQDLVVFDQAKDKEGHEMHPYRSYVDNTRDKFNK